MINQHFRRGSLLILQIGIVLSLALASEGNVKAMEDISLSPMDLEVTAGSIATFTCSLKCEYESTHTLQWNVGEHSFRNRRVLYSFRARFENRFERKTGMRVTITKQTTCEQGDSIKQTLSFVATSAQKSNKTVVQCAAIKRRPNFLNIISFYSILFVKDPVPTAVIQKVIPNPNPSSVCSNQTMTVTKYLTVTKTVYSDNASTTTVLPTPNLAPIASGDKY